MKTNPTFTLLIVDDEPDVVDALRRTLEDPRLEIVGCTRPSEALDVLATHEVDLVISDLDMPEMHGLDLLRRVRQDHPEVIRIVLTGRASLDSALDAINQGEVQRYLTKPWNRAKLRETIDEALERIAELRRSADAARRVALREQIRQRLESSHPGITKVELDDGVVLLDPVRLDACWTLRDVASESLADTWILDGAEDRSHSGSPSADLHRMSGVVLDQRFRLEEPIGSGGFGVVYRALQLSLERFVAVKVLRLEGTGLDYLKRFRVEALSSCRVVHPNAVTVLDAGVSDQGLAYLVMELLTGETLAQRLARGDTLSFEAGAAVAADLCGALAVAHDSGILHRDVKPANVFLHQGPQGPVTKLLDFGIAKLASPRDSHQGITADDLLVGTPAYIAPERISNGEMDGRVDVYGVGVLLYEMLSGVRPFEGESPTEVARKQLNVYPRPLIAIDASVPPELDALVTRMLFKEPERRPTAGQAVASLRDLLPRLPARHMRVVVSSRNSSATTESAG
jgi:eukaryotic-like serine/threonine-protein kinase